MDNSDRIILHSIERESTIRKMYIKYCVCVTLVERKSALDKVGYVKNLTVI